MIKIALILFPGSNCERETAEAVKRAGMHAEEFLWNENLAELSSFDGYILIGGFSYEDRSRAGIIAALDPLMDELKIQALNGKPILGICNGAQILVEAGMVPGLEISGSIALTDNKRIKDGKVVGLGFYNAWVNICLAKNSKPSAFNADISPSEVMHIPLAHAEGRFIMSAEMEAILKNEGLIAFNYCDEKARISENFPVNPNGSQANIAAIINSAGNVMALMPHPERTKNGDAIFHSMCKYINCQIKPKVNPPKLQNLIFNPPKPYKKRAGIHQSFSKLIINDNAALTVQARLRSLGFPVTVERIKYWEIECAENDLPKIKSSELLYCPRKEKELRETEIFSDQSLVYLVLATEDLVGLKTLQSLKQHFKLSLSSIKYHVLWKFSSHEKDISELMEGILKTQIIGNSYAQRCYLYQPN